MEKKLHIPIEFLPGLWVTVPEGIEGRGSGFLLAENIKSVFAIDIQVPNSKDTTRNWTVLNITEQELMKNNYVEAFIRIIIESWLDTGNIIIIGTIPCIKRILINFMKKTCGLSDDISFHIISSKIE
jgi:hypothetical protein